jgi:hypothetical protein
MSTPRDLSVPLERIAWRDGQTLLASDLRDNRGYSDRLRHLHIRYRHKSWGVVEGLGVLAADSDSAVVIPGYALDTEGRELLLQSLTRVAAPANIAANTTMYLTISWGTAAGGCASTPDLATLCPGVAAPLPVEAGVLAWKTVIEVQPGLDVLLARALIANGKLASAVDTSIQRRAASMYQPLMWYDVTLAGQTGWSDKPEGPLAGIQATVDTSDAGFIATPAYFAYLSGTSQVAAGFISSASATSLTFVVRPASEQGLESSSAKALTAATAESNGWTIAWIGVELAPMLPVSAITRNLL